MEKIDVVLEWTDEVGVFGACEALQKIEQMNFRNPNKWRMPTVEEFQKESESGRVFGRQEDRVSYGAGIPLKYSRAYLYWSSSTRSAPGENFTRYMRYHTFIAPNGAFGYADPSILVLVRESKPS